MAQTLNLREKRALCVLHAASDFRINCSPLRSSNQKLFDSKAADQKKVAR